MTSCDEITWPQHYSNIEHIFSEDESDKEFSDLENPSDDLEDNLKSKKRTNVHTNFTVNSLGLDQLYAFDTFPLCQFNTDCFYLIY